MSLINQMLRDLDSRRGPAAGAQVLALQGMGLVNVNRVGWLKSFSLWLPVLGGALALFIIYHSMAWLNSRPKAIEDPLPLVSQVKNEATVAPVSQFPATGRKSEPADDAPAIDTKRTDKTDPSTDSVPAEPTPVTNKGSGEVIKKTVNALSPEQKADRLFSMAQQAIARHQYLQGEQLLQQVLVEHRQHVVARAQLAAILVQNNKTGKAERLLAEGLETYPLPPELAIPYARLLTDRNELAPALDTMNRLIAANDREPRAFALRAAIHAKLKRYGESARDYRTALHYQPEQASWWTGLAIALEQNNQVESSLKAYKRAGSLPLDEPLKSYVQQRIQSIHATEYLN